MGRGLRNSRPNKTPRRPVTGLGRVPVDDSSKEVFLRAGYGQRVCAVTGLPTSWRTGQVHHVIEKQWLRINHKPRWDPRNALLLRTRVHELHTGKLEHNKIPLSALRDENFEFAFEQMGAAAYNYLRRHYRGEDPRLEEWLARVE